MLARIAHDALLARPPPGARRAHRAHARRPLPRRRSQGRPDDPRSVTLVVGLAARDHGRRRRAPSRPARRDEVIRALTLDPDNPVVDRRPASTRAREGARTVRDTISGRDVGVRSTRSTSRSHGATSTPACAPAPTRSTAYVKERTALFWGLTVAHDAAATRPRAFLVAGGRIEAADMVLRMLRVALPPARRGRRGPEAPRRDGNALALLRAVGGFQAFMRAAAAPPNAEPVARFLLYERDFPDSVAASRRRAARRARRAPSRPARSRRRCCALRRMPADLEFRGRATADGRDAARRCCEPSSRSSSRVDAEHRRALFPRRRRVAHADGRRR